MHNIRSLHNVGSAFRSCDAFGVNELWLSGYTPVPPRPEITKTAIGAEEHVNWKQVQNPADAITNLKQAGYSVIGLEQTDGSILLNEFVPESDKICLVVGNEVTGIDDELLPHIDLFVEIPQFGMKHSLNVSVASGIALYSFMDKLSK